MITGPLAVRADLALSVDGQSARLTGDGTDLTLTSSDPVALWRSAAGVPWPAGLTVRSGPRAIGELGALLTEHGLHLDVTGPHGRAAELGHGVSSPVGRVLTGSASVRLVSTRTLAGTVAAEPLSWRSAVALAPAVLAVLVVVRALRRR